MKCQLCLEDRLLIKKSHIIPNFMYNGLFNAEHFMISVQFTDLENTRRLRTGVYDKYVLCKTCDNNIIGQYESYASQILYGGRGFPSGETPRFENCPATDEYSYLKIHNLNYKKFKLFLLSLLWRAHISKHPFFKAVDLGNSAEEIRSMILNDDPGLESQYETCLIYLDTKDKPVKSIIDPRPISANSNSGFAFHINGMLYLFNLDNNSPLTIFKNGRITKNNSMDVQILEGKMAENFFDAYTGRKIKHWR